MVPRLAASSLPVVVSAQAISVVIPYFNRAATLARAIHSVRIQSDCDPEIIVVDDCSDEPPEARLGDAVRVVRLEANRGPGHARNCGVELAAHPIVAFLDADDEWLPGKLSRQLELLRPGTCVAGGVLKQDDRSGHVTKLLAPAGDPGAWIVRGNPINPSTVVVYADDHAECGGFPEDRACAEDWVYVGRLLKAGIRLAAVDDYLALMHRDGKTTTSDVDVAVEHALGAVRLFRQERLAGAADLPLMEALANVNVARMRANSGSWIRALRHAWHALRVAPRIEVAGQATTIPMAGLRGVVRRRLLGRA
jgi:glycosyltransferase involved in cell wall biosynthesis